MNAPVYVLVGGQYGSEGKGRITSMLADNFYAHVRVGGANAGHVFHHDERPWTMCCVPCGWKNPKAQLVLGAGAVVDPARMAAEVAEIEGVYGEGYVTRRLWIDPNATLTLPEDKLQEGGTAGELHHRIGSTGKGVGAARIGRLMRSTEDSLRVVRGNAEFMARWGAQVSETVVTLHRWMSSGRRVFVEGTQGSGLSLTHGPWPYVTTADTNASGLLADCGIAPSWCGGVGLVVRSMPIRVAGPSGPLRGELTWDQVSTRAGRVVSEQTTVTKKTRRIGEWDEDLLMAALLLNRPTHIFLTFGDYVDKGRNSYVRDRADASVDLLALINKINIACRSAGLDDTHVSYVSVGPKDDEGFWCEPWAG